MQMKLSLKQLQAIIEEVNATMQIAHDINSCAWIVDLVLQQA